MSLIAIALGVASQVIGAIKENKAEKAANAAKLAANNVNAPAQVQQTQAPAAQAAQAKTIKDKIARANANRAANPPKDNKMMYYVGAAIAVIVGLFFAFKKL